MVLPQQRLVGERTGQSFQLGAPIRVLVASVNLDERKIDLEPVALPISRKQSRGKGASQSTAKPGSRGRKNADAGKAAKGGKNAKGGGSSKSDQGGSKTKSNKARSGSTRSKSAGSNKARSNKPRSKKGRQR